jgi:hypothetical protein
MGYTVNDGESAPFTCIECGTFNGKTDAGHQRDHCEACGVSLHTQIGDDEHPPCGGVMRVKWSCEYPYDGMFASGMFTLGMWDCECGFRLFAPIDEDSEDAVEQARVAADEWGDLA